MLLLKNGDWTLVFIYSLTSVIIGVLAAFGGFWVLK
jgi:fluoride ion exporter CrcB/FEX